MVEIDWTVVLIQFVTFLIAIPLIWNSMIKALIRTLKAREEHITNTLTTIEKDKTTIEVIKTDYEKKVQEMQTESIAAVNKAVTEGEKMKSAILDEAKKEGAKLIEDAKREIEIEKIKALEAVKDAIVDISMTAAEKVLHQKISKKDQIEIVDDKLKEIGKAFH
jgi:F-type H+-transporting ATPase subunit b